MSTIQSSDVQQFLSSLQSVITKFSTTLDGTANVEPKKSKKVKKLKTSKKLKQSRAERIAAQALCDLASDKCERVELVVSKADKKRGRGRPRKPTAERKSPKIVRKCPEPAAKDFQVGDSMTGRDGFVWIVAQRPESGHLYWKKAYLIEDRAKKLHETVKKSDNTCDDVEISEVNITTPKKRGRPRTPTDERKSPKVERKCPKGSAKDAGLDATCVGLDGQMWVVHARPNSGHHYWKRIKAISA